MDTAYPLFEILSYVGRSFTGDEREVLVTTLAEIASHADNGRDLLELDTPVGLDLQFPELMMCAFSSSTAFEIAVAPHCCPLPGSFDLVIFVRSPVDSRLYISPLVSEHNGISH